MAPTQCTQCKTIFPSKNAFKDHSASTGHSGIFVCAACTATFATVKQRKAHQHETGHRDPIDLRPLTPGSVSSNTTTASISSAAHSWAGSAVGGRWRDAVGGRWRDAQGDFARPGASSRSESESVVGSVSCPRCSQQFETSADLSHHVWSAALCTACNVCLPPTQTLEGHYWDSAAHLKCNPCALGFENLAKWTEHRAACPLSPLSYGKPPTGRKQEQQKGGAASQPAAAAAKVPSARSVTPFNASASSVVVQSVPSALQPLTSRDVNITSVESNKQEGEKSEKKKERVEQRFSCDKCNVKFASMESLQNHYTLSPFHPTCRTCGLGFESLDPWAKHKASCPPPADGKSLDAPSTGGDATSAPPPGDSHGRGMSGTATVRSSSLPALESLVTSTAPDSGVSSPTPTAVAASPHASSDDDGSASAIPVWLPHAPPLAAPSPQVPTRRTPGVPVGTTSWSSRTQNARAGPSAPAENGDGDGVKKLSFHCRSCLGDPCVKPVATLCGHIFCHACIMQELAAKMCCPVCDKMFLIQLRVDC